MATGSLTPRLPRFLENHRIVVDLVVQGALSTF